MYTVWSLVMVRGTSHQRKGLRTHGTENDAEKKEKKNEEGKREISERGNVSIIVTVVLICSAINGNKLRSTVAGQSQ